jgi:hypothetical protein
VIGNIISISRLREAGGAAKKFPGILCRKRPESKSKNHVYSNSPALKYDMIS